MRILDVHVLDNRVMTGWSGSERADELIGVGGFIAGKHVIP